MDQIHSSPNHSALTTQDSLPWEAISSSTRGKSPEYVLAPGRLQGQPVCFGADQLRIPERPKSARLCYACMSLGHLDSTHWEGIDNFRDVIVNHHHSFDALLKSAREGCHLCVLLLKAWEEEFRFEQEPEGGWIGKAGYGSASLNDGIRLKFERVNTTNPPTYVNIDEIQITILCGNLLSRMSGRLICEAKDSSLHALPETCLPSGSDTDTGSSASLSRIKAWLKICRSSHLACSQGDSQPPPLPTRVIAVGIKGSSRCHLVSGDKKSGYYATLSHCWGGPQHRPLSTTDSTLSCRQQGIEDEALPKTFRHAIQVCREIGIEYIWIDSLCIIQEQETQEDWAKEAPRMGHVYGNSILNISAAAAADSTQGCFQKRLGLISWPCPVVLFGQACYILRSPMVEEEIYGDPGDMTLDLANFLARRAWVLQEQILSRRSIIFSKDCLIWRCPTLSTNERYPFGIPHVPDISVDNHRLLHCIINGIASFIPKEATEHIYRSWYQVVAEYTCRDLTYEKDRLPAIAGIAKRFGVTVNDSYHAGLWRRDMIIGLIWRRPIGTTGTCIAKSDRAPSWSWASINGAVWYSHISSAGVEASYIPISPLIDVVNVSDPTICSDHPFGVMSRASLSLSGILLAVMQDENKVSGLALVDNGPFFAFDKEKIYWTVWDCDTPSGAGLFYLPVCVQHYMFREDIRGNDEPYKATWQRSLETGMDEFEHESRLYCLILQATEGNQDTYSRVGLCGMGSRKTMDISRMASFGKRRSITLV